MKMKKFVSALLASAVALSLVAGCGGGDKKKAEEKKPAAAATVKVGVFLPLTGDNAGGGELEIRGIKLANKLHPEVKGKKIELIIADNKSDKAESANVAARLIEKDKVKVILGTYGSSLAMAAGNIVKEAKVPAIGTSCTNPQVTKGNDYYFRACFIDPFQGTVMANYAFKKGAKKVAIVQEVSNDYSVGLAKFFKEAFEKLAGPGSVVDIANYQTGDKDFTAQLTNLKAKNPDAVFAPGNFTESALLVKQARQLGIKVPFMGGDTWETQDFVNVGGKDVDGVAFSSAFDSTKAATPEAKAFLDAYAKEYKGEQPGGLTALAYDSYLIALNAMKAAGSVQNAFAATAGEAPDETAEWEAEAISEADYAEEALAYDAAAPVPTAVFTAMPTATPAATSTLTPEPAPEPTAEAVPAEDPEPEQTGFLPAVGAFLTDMGEFLLAALPYLLVLAVPAAAALIIRSKKSRRS